jgi:hypothetical protein
MNGKIKFGPTDLANHYTCYFCGLANKSVEAGGMWYCPNFGCTGPGAHSHRRTLKSYKEEGSGKHSVDYTEWRDETLKKSATVTDHHLKEAMIFSARNMTTRITSDKLGL